VHHWVRYLFIYLLCAYLTKPSFAKAIKYHGLRQYVSKKYERLWKEGVVDHLSVLSRYLLSRKTIKSERQQQVCRRVHTNHDFHSKTPNC